MLCTGEPSSSLESGEADDFGEGWQLRRTCPDDEDPVGRREAGVNTGIQSGGRSTPIVDSGRRREKSVGGGTRW